MRTISVVCTFSFIFIGRPNVLLLVHSTVPVLTEEHRHLRREFLDLCSQQLYLCFSWLFYRCHWWWIWCRNYGAGLSSRWCNFDYFVCKFGELSDVNFITSWGQNKLNVGWESVHKQLLNYWSFKFTLPEKLLHFAQKLRGFFSATVSVGQQFISCLSQMFTDPQTFKTLLMTMTDEMKDGRKDDNKSTLSRGKNQDFNLQRSRCTRNKKPHESCH